MLPKLLIVIMVILSFAVKSVAQDSASAVTDNKEFTDYWYSGKAEITSYELKQGRYGQLHDGYAVLIFVSEDFSKKKQVKLDSPGNSKEDAMKVLKLNNIKKFNTGIYRYSMMNSVFTPVDIEEYPDTLKISSSSQEWCGSTCTQLNLVDDEYNVKSFSYFESEGDREFSPEDEFLEDEVWTRIRLAPRSLPAGKIKIIPGAMASRLTHRALKVETARASLEENPADTASMVYKLNYPDSGRSLEITFEKAFPYEIM
ncbi:MAG: hypothetical protein RIG61_03790 [Deltaproteobacteria bacterium]